MFNRLIPYLTDVDSSLHYILSLRFILWFFLGRARQHELTTRNQIKDKTIHLNTSTSVILSQIRSWCLNEKVVSCRGKAWLWPLSRQLTNLFIHNFFGSGFPFQHVSLRARDPQKEPSTS